MFGNRLLGVGIVLGVIAVIAVGAAVVNYFTPNVWIYIDNSSSAPMAVTIEGQAPIVVEAGKLEIVKLFAGAKKIDVQQEGKSIYTATADLFPGSPQRYLLNPDQKTRYAKYVVLYYAPGQTPTPASSVEQAFREELSLIEAFPPAQWYNLGEVEYVFEAPPQEIKMKKNATVERRQAVVRLSKTDHEIIVESAKKLSGPITVQDLQLLAAAVQNALTADPTARPQ